MTLTCPKAQQFHDEFCAPIFDKYRDNDDYIVATSDGIKWFDSQLAMLEERDTFVPVVNSEGKVIAFNVAGFPQYLFADANYLDATGDKIADIFIYLMRRYVDTKAPVGVIAYRGFRHVYAVDDTCSISE